MLDSVENTKHNYERLLKKLRKNPAYVFQLPTFKLVTEESSQTMMMVNLCTKTRKYSFTLEKNAL